MSDPKSPFDAMLAQVQQMAKAFNHSFEGFSPAELEKLWPTMPKEWMEMAFGNAIHKDGLDAKTRLFLTLAGLTCQGAQAEPQIRMTVRHALEAGATKQEIAEVIGQMSVFAGLPAVTRAAELARQVTNETEEDDPS
ncbi:hypothetical protein DDZ14_01850 [Maritimibacter sp. 55A14]|uniref:carboxymuconolactone decarboxylase family protein n=1 Tax=Maritimibacter sp. 55A14 TaxID=2174844 RepID=UPI000D6130F6|nr:carboxymuconolactone decarboxylase family protein [Maritimibacter sp. 55A14]PWE33934.1 hypothetical protein DDZ14_01850 [Maritimibacter sp. 55A14]